MKKHKSQTKWLGWRSWSGEKKLRMAGYASLVVMALLVALTLCPTNIHTIKAQDSSSFEVALDVASNIAISLGGNVMMDVTPTDNVGRLTYGVTTLDVMTSNSTGYALYLHTADGKATLNNIDPSSNEVVDSIVVATPGSEFTANTWGYAISAKAISGTTVYQPIPVNASNAIYEIDYASSAGQTDTYNLGFAAHVDNTLRAGTYTNTMVVSAIAHPAQISNLLQLTYMQDMKSELCTNSTEGMEKQLVDSRDGKKYFVTKLKDNNCWMTQNLAYEFKKLNDDGSQRYLTPGDSDVETDWAIPTDTKEIGVVGSSSETSIESWRGQDAEYGRVGHAAYGNYYTFGAATAGSGNDIESGVASSSICPKGWRLPTSGDAKTDFGVLTQGLTGPLLQQSPYYFTLSYSIDPPQGTLTYNSASGLYHSSTARIASQSYYMNLGTFLNASANSSRNKGASVRCLAK